jgi:protein-tyrosine phosphatase
VNEPFQVAVVCTANRFRSPIAAALLRRLTTGVAVDVSSYGTLDLDPAPVLPEALALAPRLGIELDEHLSRCVRNASLARADLVLGFERAHVAAAVVDAGAARERTFQLPEAVALLQGTLPAGEPDTVLRARARIALAAARRAEVGDAEWPELADPAGGRRRGYVASAREVERLIRLLVERLFG